MNQHQDESCCCPSFLPYLISEMESRKSDINKKQCSVVLLLMSHSVSFLSPGSKAVALPKALILNYFLCIYSDFLSLGKHTYKYCGEGRVSGGGQPNVVIFTLGLEGVNCT